MADANKRRLKDVFEAVYRDLYATCRTGRYIYVTKLKKNLKYFWPTLKKILLDRGYRGDIADQVKSDFMIG